MLNDIIINSLDTINIIYLWTVLNKKTYNSYKLPISMIIVSIFVTTTEYFELNFIFSYLLVIMIMKIIYKKK
ncbi:hypothetical protein B0H41_003938 [Clostridium beijerinckii]|nr:hypothetical protein [Clostridium beijerinckii]